VCVCMCMFVAIMGEKRKKCIVFSLFLFFTLFFSLSPSLFLAFFVVRAQSRGYSPRKSEEEKNKKRKQDISIQQKHNNDDSAAVYCLPSNSTYLATVRGKKRERERERKEEEKKREREKYECARARTSMNELCTHERSQRRKRRSDALIRWQ